MQHSVKYKAIAEQIIDDIKSQKLSLGQRLPSLRQLTQQQGISMTTALSSYHLLEEQGWVVTHPKSGFFVSTPFSQTDVPKQPQFQSSARRISTKLSASERQGVTTISGPLGISRISPDLMPVQALKLSIKRTTQRGDVLLQNYADPQGVAILRHSIAEHFSASGFALSADDMFVSSGCMDAIRIALLVTTKPGDSVAISSPCFDGLLNLLSNMERTVVEIPCHADGVDILQLEQQFKHHEVKAALFSSNHMNPHGISLSNQQKQALAELANTYRVPIIEDDIYGELGFGNAFPLPIKYWDAGGYVMWCSAVSKTLASGLRIGWCSAGRYLNKCVTLCATESLGQNGLMQASLADFINSNHYRKHLVATRKLILTNVLAYRQLLLQHLPKGSAVSAPQGGLVLWVQVPGLNSITLKALTEKARIDIRFGEQFTSRKLYRDCFRLNAGWKLSAEHNSKRTIEQALLELCSCVRAASVRSD